MSMPAQFISAVEADREPNARTAATLRKILASNGVEGALMLGDRAGTPVRLPLTASAVEAIVAVLLRLGANADVVVAQREREVSPEEAARLLGVSRPLVYHRMDTGRLRFRPVGTHRRIAMDDVLALKAEEDELREAARAFGEDTDEQEMILRGP